MYHFTVAHKKGLANDPVKYFAAPENQDSRVVKTIRKPNVKLIIAPFPDLPGNKDQLFFEPRPKTRLTASV
jgi:hypothetical protein